MQENYSQTSRTFMLKSEFKSFVDQHFTDKQKQGFRERNSVDKQVSIPAVKCHIINYVTFTFSNTFSNTFKEHQNYLSPKFQHRTEN